MNVGGRRANTWQAAVAQWAQKRRAQDSGHEFVAFFEKAFRAPLRLYPTDAWFGVHSNCISLTIGNMWLAAIVSSPQCVYLIVDHDMGIKGMGYLPIPSTLRYVPLGFATAKPWRLVQSLNRDEHAWNSYARACELILHSPISRNVITRNLYRKARVSELAGYPNSLRSEQAD